MSKLTGFLRHLLPASKSDIDELEDLIMAKAEESVAALTALKDQLTKANGEIQKKIQDLVDAAANADVPQAVVDAIEALKPAAQTLDDIVPDAPTPPTP